MSASGLALWLAALLLAPLLKWLVDGVRGSYAGARAPDSREASARESAVHAPEAAGAAASTWVGRAGPIVSVAAAAAALLMVPAGGRPAAIFFPGDVIAVVYLLALSRFARALGVFDGSRESPASTSSWLAEAALLMVALAAALPTRHASLTGLAGPDLGPEWRHRPGSVGLSIAALLGIVLAEAQAFAPASVRRADREVLSYGVGLRVWLYGALLLSVLLSGTHADAPSVFMGVVGLGLGLPVLAYAAASRFGVARAHDVRRVAVVLAALALLVACT